MILLERYARNLEPNVSRVERHWNNVHIDKWSPADRPASFRRSTYRIELNETRKPGGRTGTLQAMCVRDRAERQNKPADGLARFKRSAYKNELTEKRKPGGHTGTLQAICVQDRAERKKRRGKPGERVGTPQASYVQDRAKRENKHGSTEPAQAMHSKPSWRIPATW